MEKGLIFGICSLNNAVTGSHLSSHHGDHALTDVHIYLQAKSKQVCEVGVLGQETKGGIYASNSTNDRIMGLEYVIRRKKTTYYVPGYRGALVDFIRVIYILIIFLIKW